MSGIPDMTIIESDAHPGEDTITCTVCHAPLEYSGRGRRPTKCAEHKTKNTAAANSSKRSVKNTALAEQAAQALCNANSMLAMGFAVVGMPESAGVITDGHEPFYAVVYDALLADANLCRMILRGGTGMSVVTIIVAYGMLGMKVYPTAKAELTAKRDGAEN